MAEWFLKKITGQNLMDKALDLAIAEENANMIIDALKPELQDIEDAELRNEPVVIKVEGSTTGSGVRLMQSKRFEETNKVIAGAHKFIDVYGIGTIIDIYIISSVNNFNVELMVDDFKWYGDTYTNLTNTSVADSYLSAYQDASTDNYVVKFSGINFVKNFNATVFASNKTFSVLRANYMQEVTYK